MTQDQTPCVCARTVELRSQAEINKEIDDLFSLLELRLKKAGFPETAGTVKTTRWAWQDWARRYAEALAEPAVAAAEA